MSPVADSAEEIRGLYDAKATAELAAADALAPGSNVVPSSGMLLPEVALVKGWRGPAEAAGGPALSGPDGVAAASALATLGYDPARSFALLSRPLDDVEAAARAARVRAAIEAIDAPVVLALDAQAAEDVRAAFGLERLPFGRAVRGSGRTFVAVDGLEASLGDVNLKKRVWRQMQALRR